MPTMIKPEVDVTRAWKDELYYESLSEEEKVAVPAHPAGELDVAVELKPSHMSPMLCLSGTTTEFCSISPTYVTICG